MFSIVIPVYNEENYLKDCLNSIAKQERMPDQVIVVNNNSTDRSVAIARQFSFVTIVNEPRQGQVFAQANGFDRATGDIIGRIDADSILPSDWVIKVSEIFEKNSEVVAFTGGPWPYDMAHKRLAVTAFRFFNDYVTPWAAGHRLLYGTNCAFRAAAWPKVKPLLHMRRDIWEDYDLGFALAKFGQIVWVPDIKAGCSFRKFHEPFMFQLRYHWQAVRTFRLNTGWWRTSLEGLLRATIVLAWPIIGVNRLLRRKPDKAKSD
jgi:glycosyltransferase involved in cell wall biosynthesis